MLIVKLYILASFLSKSFTAGRPLFWVLISILLYLISPIHLTTASLAANLAAKEAEGLALLKQSDNSFSVKVLKASLLFLLKFLNLFTSTISIPVARNCFIVRYHFYHNYID